MQLGVIGLGRMGGGILLRLSKYGHQCIGFDTDPDAATRIARQGGPVVESLESLVAQLDVPRQVWMMLPAGQATSEMAQRLLGLLDPGDVVIDGGNSHFREDIRVAKMFAERKISFVDVGTSGGIYGSDRGYCLMVGGKVKDFERLEPLFVSLATGPGDMPDTAGRESVNSKAELGYLHCGDHGAGHFVKMIHNGIEYGMMQSLAEGFELLRSAGSAKDCEERYTLPVADIAELWRHGSVVSSWLLDLSALALAEDGELAKYGEQVADSGEGRWTVQAAVDLGVPAHVLTAALYARFRSRTTDDFASRMLSALRAAFGGHPTGSDGQLETQADLPQ